MLINERFKSPNKEFEKVRDQIKSFIINFIKEELI